MRPCDHYGDTEGVCGDTTNTDRYLSGVRCPFHAPGATDTHCTHGTHWTQPCAPCDGTAPRETPPPPGPGIPPKTYGTATTDPPRYTTRGNPAHRPPEDP